MSELSKRDLAFNACVDAANEASQRLVAALDDYNAAAGAAEAIHPGTGPQKRQLTAAA